MSDKEKSEFLESWREFKDEHPALYTAAAVLPVTGQVTAAVDYADAMERGDSVDGAIAAASFIPGVGAVKNGAKILGKTVKGVAPAAHELDIAKNFAPNSARARLAPATKNADKIGLTADAEQSGEAFAKEGKKEAEKREADKQERERAHREYIAQWAERG